MGIDSSLCEVFARYADTKPPFNQVPESDQSAFREARQFLKGVAEKAAEEYPGEASVIAKVSMLNPSGKAPGLLWSCLIPEGAPHKSFTLQIAVILSANGCEALMCMGAEKAEGKDAKKRMTYLTATRHALAEVPEEVVDRLEESLKTGGWSLRSGWQLPPSQAYAEDFANLSAWLSAAAEPSGSGLSISRYLSPPEVNEANVREVLQEATLTFAELYDFVCDGLAQAPMSAEAAFELLTREDILKAIQAYEEGAEHKFGSSTTYDLIHEGKPYPPKAIIGLAAQPHAGRDLVPTDFSGGVGKPAFQTLEKLGFEVRKKSDQAKEEREELTLWALSAGEGGSQWEAFRKAPGFATIGWDFLGDLRDFETQEEIEDRIKERMEKKSASNDARACFEFSREVKKDHYILAKAGLTRLLGIGRVREEYSFDPNRSEHQQVLGVDWLYTEPTELPENCRLPRKTLTRITRSSVRDLVRSLLSNQPPPPPPAEGYTFEAAMDGVFFPDSTLREILASMKRKKNVVLQGPPGVGKSFIARRLAYALLNQKDSSRVGMVQFHQSYSYEDFVQGYRPSPEGGFVRANGIFYEFCVPMIEGKDTRPRVFIIDEINRGNLSKILGELMLLIEHDKRGPEHGIPLTYSEAVDEEFFIPEEVYVIGLMNTADRSLAIVDYALRRRFTFFDMRPQFDSPKFRSHLKAKGVEDELAEKIITRLSALNSEITEDTKNLGPGFCVGHSYFCPGEQEDAQEDWYEAVIQQEIGPMLREYWFDRPSVAEKKISELLA